jgi:hypothetical protein
MLFNDLISPSGRPSRPMAVDDPQEEPRAECGLDFITSG